MQVGDAVPTGLDQLAHALRQPLVRVDVEQDRPGVADQPVGPGGDHDRADETDDRIHPVPAEEAAEQQAHYHEGRDRGVRQHMDDGAAHVVVPMRRAVCICMLVIMGMGRLIVIVLVVVVVMVSTAAEQEHAGDVHDQPQDRDRDRLVEVDRDRGYEARDRLVADQQRDHRQDDGAGKPREIAELAGAEGEASVLRMAPRVAIGEGREQQRARVGRHVQTVGDQCDRPEQGAADDLRHHHRRAQRDHHPGTALVALVAFAEKDVVVDRGAAFDHAHALTSDTTAPPRSVPRRPATARHPRPARRRACGCGPRSPRP